MAARSPPSQLPPPPARQLGPWSPRVGRGAVAHAVRSETSGLEGAARGGVVDKSDLPWRGEEGSEGQRGPAGTAPAQAPLLSAPTGSMRLEGISVEEAMVTRTQLLEEELSSVKEELALCQVSKWPPAFPLHSGVGAASLSLCLRLCRCAGLGPTHLCPAALLPGSHTQPGPLLAAEGGGRAQPGDLRLPPFSGPWPGRTASAVPGLVGLVAFTWIPPKRADAPHRP